MGEIDHRDPWKGVRFTRAYELSLLCIYTVTKSSQIKPRLNMESDPLIIAGGQNNLGYLLTLHYITLQNLPPQFYTV